MGKPDTDMATLFFDLDGTLADPREGMVKCLTYALRRLGRAAPGAGELLPYIGPSLRWTFPRLLGSDEPELIETAVRAYRERYSTVGLFEQVIYPGIPPLLKALRDDGFALYVVTSKPKIYAEKIVEHFDLAKYFKEVFGPQLDGRFDDKTELIAYIFSERPLSAGRAIMIGDRASDIAAGKANGARTIAVTYGFGSPAELAAAEADYACSSPDAIRPTVLQAFCPR